jgi:hypothetical protein
MLPKLATIFAAVLSVACTASVPLAWAGPKSQRSLSCTDGSTFTVEYSSPDTAAGINSTFKIMPGATGPAAEASAFAVHYRIVYDEVGAVVIAFGTYSPDRQDLVHCVFPSASHPGYTVEDMGLYVGPSKS